MLASKRNIDPTILASTFLHAPFFKYIEYTELIDAYQSGDVNIVKNEVNSSHEELYVGKDEEFLNFIDDEKGGKFKELEEPRHETKFI